MRQASRRQGQVTHGFRLRVYRSAAGVSARGQRAKSIGLVSAHNHQVRNRWFAYEAGDRHGLSPVPCRAATLRSKRRSTRC